LCLMLGQDGWLLFFPWAELDVRSG